MSKISKEDAFIGACKIAGITTHPASIKEIKRGVVIVDDNGKKTTVIMPKKYLSKRISTSKVYPEGVYQISPRKGHKPIASIKKRHSNTNK